jgi:chromosome segregation protein
LERDIERLDAVETPLAERQSELERERDALEADLAVRHRDVAGLEHRLALLEARRDALESTPGSRFLASHRGRAVGLVRELVRAEPGFERALSAGLGAFADAVVYDDFEAALSDAPGGGGAAIGVARPGHIAPSLPGWRPLLDVVHIASKARAFVTTLLRDVYLSASIGEASAGSRAHPRCSFVTPEGVLVGPSLIRTAADDDTRAADLDSQAQALQRDLTSARAAVERIERRLHAGGSELEVLRTELESTDAAITAAADSMGRLAAEGVTLAREEELLAERLAGLDDAQAAWRDTLARSPVAPTELPSLPPQPEPPMALRVEVESLRLDARRTEEAVTALRAEREALASADPRAVEREVSVAEDEREGAERALATAEDILREATERRSSAAAADRRVAEAETEVNRKWREQAAALERLREDYEHEDRARADLERRITEAERVLSAGHGRDPHEAVAALSSDDKPEDLERRSELVARRLALLGRVNLLAQGEYRTLQERHDFLVRELGDIKAARRDLFEVITHVDERIVRLFEEAFRDVAREFEQLFGGLFPGGEGRLTLTDPDDLLSTGIELEARPGRKRVKRISLLSGGERALTALAFLFAIFRARPSPFYLLDEVEAALDDINLHRFLELIQGFAESSQVLLITHQKRTMEVADVLYGVSMGRDGSSAVVAQRLEDPNRRLASDGAADGVVRLPESDAVSAMPEGDAVP